MKKILIATALTLAMVLVYFKFSPHSAKKTPQSNIEQNVVDGEKDSSVPQIIVGEELKNIINNWITNSEQEKSGSKTTIKPFAVFYDAVKTVVEKRYNETHKDIFAESNDIEENLQISEKEFKDSGVINISKLDQSNYLITLRIMMFPYQAEICQFLWDGKNLTLAEFVSNESTKKQFSSPFFIGVGKWSAKDQQYIIFKSDGGACKNNVGDEYFYRYDVQNKNFILQQHSRSDLIDDNSDPQLGNCKVKKTIIYKSAN